MKTEKSILCGKRLKHLRTYLGLSQEEFGKKLGEWGVQDRTKSSVGKSAEVVASWESGRNQIQASVIRAIVDNCTYEGEQILFSYLNGESDYITKGINGIIFSTFNRMQEMDASDTKWQSVTIEELANDPDNKLSLLIYDEIFPLLNFNKDDVFDKGRLYIQIKNSLINIIEEYIKKEERGD